jgi:hypothetical protein
MTPSSIKFHASILTVSEANCHRHWCGRQKRAKAQRAAVLVYLMRAGAGAMRAAKPEGLAVRFTRVGKQYLDDDNLAGAFKHVRDGVAEFFGVDDGNRGFWTWNYDQRIGMTGIEIEIRARLPMELMPKLAS